MPKPRFLLSAVSALAAAATLTSVATAQDRLPRECRREIVQLCGRDRDEIRTCLAQRASELSEQCRLAIREQIMQRAGPDGANRQRQGRAANATPPTQTAAYGRDPLQQLDFWAGAAPNAPLVVFVHGGGWSRGDMQMMRGSAKLAHWQAAGYAVASLNYRLVPDARVEEQAQDVADAVAYLRSNASQLGVDARRIALIGHSAGAHLVALVGTDPAYFAQAGLGMGDVRGIIPLDGAAYDVADQMGENAMLLGDTYEQAFGTDPVRQRALSPTHHAAGPNAPEFLILHVEREDGARQSRALAEALQRGGTTAQVQGFAGRGLVGHMEINRRLGEEDYPATPVVDRFLARIFAR